MLDLYPEELKYAPAHQWVRVVEGGNYVFIGFTPWVLEKFGDLKYIDLPEVDLEFDLNEEIGVLEFVADKKYEIYSPVSGKIVMINEELEESPGLINTDPYGDGWICKIKVMDTAEIDDLMSHEEYQEFLANIIE